MSIEPLRACLIGCGRMGATIDDEVPGDLPYSHAAGYVAADGVELVALCDARPDQLERIKERYQVAHGYTDYHQMVSEQRPDIVSVATRPGTHTEMVVYLAEAGVRGIYCEKPLCCSMAEADRMRTACEADGVRFNYGTNRRYQPLYRRMRALVSEGIIGNLQAVICHCGAGGAQWSQTHMADMMLFLAGDPEVQWVQGSIGTAPADWRGDRLPLDPSLRMAYVQFTNGVQGYHTAAGGYEFEVSGTKGKLRTLDNGRGFEWRPANENSRIFEEIPRSRGTVECVEDLVQAVRDDRPTLSGIELACRSQEMILALVASGRDMGQRVELPLANRELYVGRDDW